MINRRSFIKHASAGLLASALPNIIIPQQKRSLGVALVGLGYYSTDLLAPALQLTRHCHLAGVVTGSPNKIPKYVLKYGLQEKNVYNYENMHLIANNPDIDIIYIVVPTGLHAKYAIAAANTGKHVWCEKPMARTAQECQAIIDSCNKNKVKLSIGYRMQHEPNTQTIIKYGREKPFGQINSVSAEAGYYERRENIWKLKKEMGGGAMYDMGVYSLNGIRYAAQEEPIAVTARHENSRTDMFDEVDETTYFDLEFPSGTIGKGMTSFGQNVNHLKVNCEKGWYELKPFQAYSGIKGKTSTGTLLNAVIPNQQAKQMDDDALAIMHNADVIVPGEEGMKDIIIVEAIYNSAKNGARVVL